MQNDYHYSVDEWVKFANQYYDEVVYHYGRPKKKAPTKNMPKEIVIPPIFNFIM